MSDHSAAPGARGACVLVLDSFEAALLARAVRLVLRITANIAADEVSEYGAQRVAALDRIATTLERGRG